MSSAGFETVLVPAACLRSGVFAFSALAAVTGLILIAGLPLLPLFRIAVAVLWASSCGLEMASLVGGMCRTARIRIHSDGSLEALSAGGTAQPLELLPGSVVLGRVAWLRLCFRDGLGYGELLTGNPRQDDGWRKLQLLWRQRTAVFGGPQGS